MVCGTVKVTMSAAGAAASPDLPREAAQVLGQNVFEGLLINLSGKMTCGPAGLPGRGPNTVSALSLSHQAVIPPAIFTPQAPL